MIKIIVVSDNHGLRKPLEYLQHKYEDADAFIHCGDICLPNDEFPRFITVSGNNDYYDYPYERVVNDGGHKILVVHGHLFGYMKRTEKMIKRAKEAGCDIVCYGHTHVFDFHEEQGIVFLNPGSIFRSRNGEPPSYAIMTIAADGVVRARQIYYREIDY